MAVDRISFPFPSHHALLPPRALLEDDWGRVRHQAYTRQESCILYITRVRGKLLRNVWTPPSLLTGRGVTVRTHWYLFNIMFLNIWTIKTVRQFVSLRLILATAFDSVNYSLLSAKLINKQLPLNPYIVNWYHSFLHQRQQRVLFGNHVCTWQAVNKRNDLGRC